MSSINLKSIWSIRLNSISLQHDTLVNIITDIYTKKLSKWPEKEVDNLLYSQIVLNFNASFNIILKGILNEMRAGDIILNNDISRNIYVNFHLNLVLFFKYWYPYET